MLAQYAMDSWLTEAYDYEPLRRGQLCSGVILKREDHGITIDLGLKRDGFVPQSDLERLTDETIVELKPGQKVLARLVQPGGLDDVHILSLAQAQQEKDWQKAQGFLDDDVIWEGQVIGYNRGGLLVQFGQIQAFVPASHLNHKRLSAPQRQETLKNYVGQTLSLKYIEVNRDNDRLIASERLARQKLRDQNLERLLGELMEGEIHRGTVTNLVNFGAFVDLGGADGLIHISELAWRKVRHPSEVLQVGDEIDVYILRLDHERKRISLSLKRLQPDPWLLVQETLAVDQLVAGTVTSLADFGAFVALEVGVEGLVHTSELADPPPDHPQEVVQRGDTVLARILTIDPLRQRLGLSLKGVSPEERAAWLAEQSQ